MVELTVLVPRDKKIFIEDFLSRQKHKRYQKRRFTEDNPDESFEACLCDVLAIPSSARALAAVSACYDGLPGDEGFWLRADPLEQKADMRHVYGVGNQHLAITPTELDEIQRALQDFLQQDDIAFYAASPYRWYIQTKQPLSISTKTFSQIKGLALGLALPDGKDGPLIRRLMTELQMLLHALPLNQKRRESGMPEISGVWFWGEGHYQADMLSGEDKIIYTDDDLLKALAQQCHRQDVHALKQFSEGAVNKNSVVCLNDVIGQGDMEELLVFIFKSIEAKQLDKLIIKLDGYKPLEIKKRTFLSGFW